jgi:hypothetical protein
MTGDLPVQRYDITCSGLEEQEQGQDLRIVNPSKWQVVGYGCTEKLLMHNIFLLWCEWNLETMKNFQLRLFH